MSWMVNKKSSIVVSLCMIFSTGLELLGVSAIYPFLQVMLLNAGMEEKWYVRWIYYFVPNASKETVLLVLGIGIIIIYLLKNAMHL